ncbi:DUF4352 domain-containing protein [Listeria kieliensis]|uniref:DUF4352 domain-containing protein n=1 Tax=Listeria kieliensis TaxID=1621700 RepID=A0A3D8TRD8_9LIST|nr:DUF4352 domain-containing protein [Listeria kieliensis]RDX01360.1 hypothetical protein UR08_10620 [Listeria kieliensis]
MKKVWLSVILGLIVVLGACSTTADSDSSQEGIKAKAGSDMVDGLKIDIKNLEVNKNVNTKKEIYTFTVKGENRSSVSLGLGSIDFALKTTSNKLIEPDPAMKAFGDNIFPGKSLKGFVSFSVPETTKIKALVYKPKNKELIKWTVSKDS